MNVLHTCQKLLARAIKGRTPTTRRAQKRRLGVESLESRQLMAAGPLVAGAGAGSSPLIRVYDPTTLTQQREIMAFESGFTGGIRVATGDINGDGTPDIIAA